MSSNIKTSKRILVTGSNGLCGSAIREESKNSHHNFIFSTRDEADLTVKDDVIKLFIKHRPNYVIHTSAKVGGIGANQAMQEDFFYNNIIMNANVIRACVDFKVEKLFAFSSVCTFPDDLAMLEEEKMHDGPVYNSNFAYGYAKRMVDVHIRAAMDQYGFKNWCSIIPGNIFGKHDMFSIENGHIIPALIHKAYLAQQSGQDFHVWGDGKSLREFIYVNDLARIILELLDKDNIPDKVIVSGQKERSIESIVDVIADFANIKDKVVYDTTKPNGQRSRPSSKDVIKSLLPDFQYTTVNYALWNTMEWFWKTYPNVRTDYGG